MAPIDSRNPSEADVSHKNSKSMSVNPPMEQAIRSHKTINMPAWRLLWHKILFFILGYLSFVPLSIVILFVMIFYGSCSFVTHILGKIFSLIS